MDSAQVDRLQGLGYGTFLLGWVCMGVVWFILGLSFWAVLKALAIEDTDLLPHLHLYVASVALATVAGFLSLIPGGVVVREAVLAQLVVPYFGGGVALVSAVLLRLVWLTAELVVSGTLYFAGLRSRLPRIRENLQE